MSEHVANGCHCEEPPEPQPLDLDKLQIAHDVYRRDGEEGNGPQAQTYLLDAVPGLLAELREARAEIEWWQALPTRDEYACAVGGKKHPDDCTQVWHTGDADEALRWADNGTTGRAWTRAIALHPWVELSAEPPF
ncbi:hypothetical protein FLW53_09360 [Microbispora sp. SCL1-1]|uniref:hypothetical protein n=1 Tax=unclassified Microbispora TaxID=2614687 RepID=UPI00115B7547|nr:MULTISPECIES: hypothetical protein [unclassified Microbispora]NJP24406.1 hypothetical protein [Microbispora sp. CL1-1]TQS14560.1 hypothetical protein FLW53_09360 [Microbispora sp. SCL1-1]